MSDAPVIVRLEGGLGNQLFQYAAGRTIALETGRKLLLDLSAYSEDRLRSYQLDHFAIAARPLRRGDVPLLQLRRSRLRGLVPRRWRYGIVREAFPARLPVWPERGRVSDAGAPYLIGYWQSERYFAAAVATIRQELRLQAAPRGVNARLLDEIAGCDAVALHVRRGDYVSNPAATAYHGLCGLDYYRGAIRRLEETVPQPHFFVFSDDLDWVRANLDTGHPTTWVGDNADTPWEDLRLMAACRHFIVANSSFSWWGAWLGAWPGKQVIAPARWFQADHGGEGEIVPAEWLRM
jgi:hypothetical protein